MSLFGSAMDFLGLTPDMGGAINAAQFNPYNVNQSTGSVNYDAASRTFNSQLNPQLQGIQQGLFSQYGAVDPTQQLNLMRQQAQPFNEQMGLNLENRLFKQGLTGASVVDQPGGARRSFFDSVLNQDMGFQMQAQQQAQQQQMAYLQQLLGISGMENNMFSNAMGMGGIGMQGQMQQSNLMGQSAMAMPNLLGSLLGGAAQGFMMG